jgi:hypothetical protein
MVGNGEEFDPLTLCFRNIIVQGAVGVGAGDGMHVQVNRIHHNLLSVCGKNSRNLRL